MHQNIKKTIHHISKSMIHWLAKKWWRIIVLRKGIILITKLIWTTHKNDLSASITILIILILFIYNQLVICTESMQIEEFTTILSIPIQEFHISILKFLISLFAVPEFRGTHRKGLNLQGRVHFIKDRIIKNNEDM